MIDPLDFGNELEIGIDTRLYNGGHFVYSSQLAALLRRCQVHQSLHRASGELKIGYRRALQLVATAEKGLGQQLLHRTIGGIGGGGSRLTPFGRLLTEGYIRLERELADFAAARWAEEFPGTRAKALFPGGDGTEQQLT